MLGNRNYYQQLFAVYKKDNPSKTSKQCQEKVNDFGTLTKQKFKMGTTEFINSIKV